MTQNKECKIIIPETPSEKANFIMKILKTIEIQYTQNGIRAYIDTKGKKEEMAIDSKKFQSIISSYYFSLCNEVVSMGIIKNCIMSFQGAMLLELEEIKQKTRLWRNKSENAIYIDKADNYYSYFKITPNGWSLEKNGQRFFLRNPNQGEMPIPDRRNADVEKIFKYCRIPSGMKNIFIAYIISCFIPSIKHPCLVLEGEKGLGKSSVSKFIKAIVDPKNSEEPNANLLPRDIQQITYSYKHNYLLAFDNLEKLNRAQSDFLCSIVTGVDSEKRKLFTDDEICCINLCQPVILNGIKNIVTQDDMINRSIIMTLEKPDDVDELNDNEEKYLNEFMEDRSIILGGIFDILVEALRTFKPNSIPKRPRMAAFYEWGYYICEAWKKGYGKKFCEEYWNLIDKQANIENWDDPLPHALIFLLESYNNKEWVGTITNLVEELKDICYEYELTGIPLYPIPLSKKLKAIDKYIKTQGIYIKWGKTKDNCTEITLSFVED